MSVHGDSFNFSGGFNVSDSSGCFNSSSGDGFATAHVGPLVVSEISVKVL